MDSLISSNISSDYSENGFAILDNIYSNNEVVELINCIENSFQNNDSFLKTNDLFAIRQLLNNIPELEGLIFNKNLKNILSSIYKTEYFLTKAIYFDKPKESNWFVGYHQDLSISVNTKAEVEGYKNWTKKKNHIGVQPPIDILESTITVRIHLDETDSKNGALKVIPKSHSKGIIRSGSENWLLENEEVCEVKKGGIMLMKPLILHASNRTKNKNSRRVIHLEFNTQKLKEPLKWLELLSINNH